MDGRSLASETSGRYSDTTIVIKSSSLQLLAAGLLHSYNNVFVRIVLVKNLTTPQLFSRVYMYNMLASKYILLMVVAMVMVVMVISLMLGMSRRRMSGGEAEGEGVSKYTYETLAVSQPSSYVTMVMMNRPHKSNAMNTTFWK